MTRKWVKEELKKNPLENAVIKTVDYVRNNKNNVIAALVAVLVIGLFAGVIVRNRINESREAARILAFAQNDYSRFNYNAAVEKLKNIEQKYSSAKIMDQVVYLQGLSYYKQKNFQKAKKVLEKAAVKFKDSKILPQIKITLGAVYEEINDYDKALEQYKQIDENHYLKSEALTSAARIYEVTGKTQKAIETYTKINAHYPNTFWGNFASERLSALGIRQPEEKEYQPQLD